MGVEYVRILTDDDSILIGIGDFNDFRGKFIIDDDSILIGIGDFNDFRGKFIIEEVYGNELIVSELSEWTRKG